jgi:predicted cation transporter
MKPSIPGSPAPAMAVGLFSLVVAILVLPFAFRKIEENLEPFFLVIGAAALTVSGLWDTALLWQALKAPVMIGRWPIGIFQVVLALGLLIHAFNPPFTRWVLRLAKRLGHRVFIFLLIALAGLLSGVISVILAASLLIEIVVALPLARADRKRLIVIACFAAGMGACLTPLGEPLSTILVAKLAGPPHHAGFFFPLRHFGIPIIVGVLGLAGWGARSLGPRMADLPQGAHAHDLETPRTIVVRALRIYIFIAALVLIGEGFKPLMVWYLIKIPPAALYWINTSSAVLDNATLAAIEIGPSMSLSQITGIVLGLCISGGMLIPGNIPNIVAAGRLKISMKEWAAVGVPIGLILMTIYFVALYIL